MDRELIFDVGMNNGADTAYYLHRGFRVVSVEANPELCRQARTRFSDALATRRLVIENVAIHQMEGTRQFYLSEVDEWSSFDERIAARDGHRTTAIQVRCVPLLSLLEKYGVPHYLKIDIEGADSYCLEALQRLDTRPKYVSLEDSSSVGEHVCQLQGLSYRKFKLIDQRTYLFRSQYVSEPLWARIVGRARRKSRNLMHGRWRNDWSFVLGSSGPFGEDTDKWWVGADRLLQLRNCWEAAYRNSDHALEYGFWYDLHAKLE
jgi:FkbM family methyltransferase